MFNDEEYEKRKERARLLRNSVGMVTDNDIQYDTSNFDNDSQDNFNEYQEKLNEARKLRNSIGMTTPKDLETMQNITEDIEPEINTESLEEPKETDTVIDNSEYTDEQKRQIVNEISNKMLHADPGELMSNFFNDTGRFIENTWIRNETWF